MEIETMAANSALIRAREGAKGRSWKWKELLRFPHISQCIGLAMDVGRDYLSLCVKQPIGKKLFELFCQNRHDLQNYISLQKALDDFETKSDEERREFGLRIVQRFLKRQSIESVEAVLKHEQNCTDHLEQDPLGDIFHDCRKDLHGYLSESPFRDYQDSMYFERFLQWKAVERQPITKQTFRQYRLLGKGGFGENLTMKPEMKSKKSVLQNLQKVWACQVRATGKMYACKKLDKTHIKKRRGESMAINEKEILEKIDSRFVVTLAYAYETRHSLCMVLSIMNGGDLRFHIYKMGSSGLDKERVRFYAAEVSCGLKHLHQNGIIYRDMKPENILLDDNGHIRISDLGLAVRLSEDRLVRGKVGTVGYMAPEVIGREYYGTSVDWWGLGCLVYEMTAGHPPFRGRGDQLKEGEMERRIKNVEVEYGKIFSENTRGLCRLLLTKDPKHRLGGAEAVQSHEFFQTINFRILEAGLVEPPFKPDPRLVYCSDVQDIDEFSAVKGVSLDQTDSDFYSKFNTGSVPIAWQKEIIEMGCFKELNVFGLQGSRTPDLDWSQSPVAEFPKRKLFHRIFRRHQPDTSNDQSKQCLLATEDSINLVSTAL